jgi:hypothetical protein
VEDEEEMFGPYGQGLAEDSENSDSQGVVVQGTGSPVEELSENLSIPEPAPSIPESAPSTSVESTTRVSGGFSFELQQLFQKLEENRQRDKKELEEGDKKNQQKLEEKQELLLQKHSQEIREEIKVQATEINKVREECHKKYDQLEKRFSSEIAAGIRQVHTKISNIEENRERELSALKEQMKLDNKKLEENTAKELLALKGRIEMDYRRHDETSSDIQHQVRENREWIKQNETSVAEIVEAVNNLDLNIQRVDQRAEKEAEEHQRRLRESSTRLECKIQQNQEKVAQEMSKLEQEVVGLKLDLCAQAEIRVSGTPIAIPSTSQEPVSREPVHSPLEEIATLEGAKGVQGISSGEFPLPLFDEYASVNPVAHLRHLEEFFVFRGIHKKHWLTVAKRSIGGSMSRQWLEATSSKFTNYEQFKKEFLATWWSAAQQGLTKCNLYQSKFDPSEERTTFRGNEFPRHKPNNSNYRNQTHFEEARRSSPVRQAQRGNSRNRGGWNHNPRYNRERDRRSMERERTARRDKPPQGQHVRETIERERSPRTRPPETSREN